MHKPNEDRWDYAVSPRCIVAAVADGVTQWPEEGGQYPKRISWKAAHLATRHVIRALRKRSPGPHDEQTLRKAVERANQYIRQLNVRLRRWDEVNARISSTLLVAWLREMPDGGAEGYVASIGDPVGLMVVDNAEIALLSTDQLAACHRYSYTHFVPEDGETTAATRKRRQRWQREYARNNPDAVRPDNPDVHVGYGVLDGDPRALNFLSIRKVVLTPGTRLLLATDALRILRPVVPDAEEAASDYHEVAVCMRESSVVQTPEVLVGRIRAAETARGARSDDATIVVIHTHV